jgi:uroporphyrinogen decarboxylase
MFFRFLRALKRLEVDRPPVWFMRQAGRYLPEYRALREQAGGFLAMCKTPELACEVTLQPLQRFELDAAIIFSDILMIPDAMRCGLYFEEGEGPCFSVPIRSLSAVKRLPIPDPEQDLGYVMEAIRLFVKDRQDVPLIGFCGSPWTVATYMVEGRSSKNFSMIKKMLYNESATLHLLLSKLAQSSALYLRAQIEAGAKAVMIFDTWGGILSFEAYREFSLQYMHKIVQELKHHESSKETPIILFTKQGGQWLEDIAATGCDAISVDWTVNMTKARERVGAKVALQGNLDPNVLYADPSIVRAETKKVLDAFGRGPGHIFNLGHGIYPDISPEKIQVVIDTVKAHSLEGATNE